MRPLALTISKTRTQEETHMAITCPFAYVNAPYLHGPSTPAFALQIMMLTKKEFASDGWLPFR